MADFGCVYCNFFYITPTSFVLNSRSDDGICNAVSAYCCYTNEDERRKLQGHNARLPDRTTVVCSWSGPNRGFEAGIQKFH